MAVLVDYLCTTCTGRIETWVVTPAPSARACPACGSISRRVWSPVGLSSRSSPAGRAAAPDGSLDGSPDAAPLCVTNPDVPGLCHMSRSAGRAWVARARHDGRALDRELERQEKAAAIKAPTLADVASHSHSSSFEYSHGQPDPSRP